MRNHCALGEDVSLEDLRRVMRENESSDSVLLRVRVGQNSRYVVLKNN